MDSRNRSNLVCYFHEIEEVRKNWGWFLAFGLLLVALGAGVISASYYATVFSVILFGLVLLGTGIVQFIQAFMARKWQGAVSSLFLGVLYLVTGQGCFTKKFLTFFSF